MIRTLCHLPDDIQHMIWRTYMNNYVFPILLHKTKRKYRRINHYTDLQIKSSLAIKNIISILHLTYLNCDIWNLMIEFTEERILYDENCCHDMSCKMYQMLEIIKKYISYPSLLYIELMYYKNSSSKEIIEKMMNLKKCHKMLIL